MISVLVLVFEAMHTVATQAPPPPGHDGVAWTLLGTGAALVIIGVMFLIKKTIYALLSLALIVVSALLLVLAVLGEPLGIYPAIHRWWSGSGGDGVPLPSELRH